MARPLIFNADGTASVPVLLSGGGLTYATIDAADAHLVDDRNWFAKPRAHTTYAHDRAGEPLHGRLFPMADEVDHRDHDGLNCRRGNLRPLSGKRTRTLQNANTRPHKDGSVVATMGSAAGRRLKGVRRDGEKFQARITVNGRRMALGSFDRPEDAARAYDRAAARAFPEAHLNYPPHPFEEAPIIPGAKALVSLWCWICLGPRKEHRQ